MDLYKLFVIIFVGLLNNLNGVLCEDEYKSLDGSTTENDHPNRSPKLLGLDVGDSDTNFEAGMWIMALLGLLAFAVPAVLMEPSLGFRRALMYVLPSWSPWETFTESYDHVTSPKTWHGMAEGLSSTLHIVIDALENIAQKYEDDKLINNEL